MGEDFVGQKWQEYMTKIILEKAQVFLKVITKNIFYQRISITLKS